MESVTIRDLRNNGAEVMARVARGESLLVTRDGTPVAQVVPLPRRSAAAVELIRRRSSLPRVDPEKLRADVDSLIDQAL